MHLYMLNCEAGFNYTVYRRTEIDAANVKYKEYNYYRLK